MLGLFSFLATYNACLFGALISCISTVSSSSRKTDNNLYVQVIPSCSIGMYRFSEANQPFSPVPNAFTPSRPSLPAD
ncbi:hypothetical protein B0T13DRAFT_152970 [Neurospora crassa]|nr:hypothetical protein B0T13DRAFT_152970 [Neurospora crassa]